MTPLGVIGQDSQGGSGAVWLRHGKHRAPRKFNRYHSDQAIFRMASVGLQGIRLACLAAVCIFMLNCNAVEGKKKSKSPEITNKVRKKLSR